MIGIAVARTPNPASVAVYGRAFSKKTMSMRVIRQPTAKSVISGATACQSIAGRSKARVRSWVVTD